MDSKTLDIIDNTIKDIWEHDIKTDYINNSLLREDTLKNSFYFHLRTKLGRLFEEENIKIFTEFNIDKFKNTNFRPDIVLVRLDEKQESPIEERIKEYICIIELKYKSDFSAAADLIYKDYDKIKYYIENMNLNCPLYYMATIWETETTSKSWLKDEVWARNLLTELNADYNSKGCINFYIHKH